MKAGETLAKDGSMDVATMLASYYVGGVGKVAVDTAKAAYYSSLGESPIVDSEKNRTVAANSTSPTDTVKKPNLRWQTYKTGGIIYYDTNSLSYDAGMDNGKVEGYVIIDRIAAFRSANFLNQKYYLPDTASADHFDVNFNFYCATNDVYGDIPTKDFQRNIIFPQTHPNDLLVMRVIVGLQLTPILENVVESDANAINNFLCPKVGQVAKQKSLYQKMVNYIQKLS